MPFQIVIKSRWILRMLYSWTLEENGGHLLLCNGRIVISLHFTSVIVFPILDLSSPLCPLKPDYSAMRCNRKRNGFMKSRVESYMTNNVLSLSLRFSFLIIQWQPRHGMQALFTLMFPTVLILGWGSYTSGVKVMGSGSVISLQITLYLRVFFSVTVYVKAPGP